MRDIKFKGISIKDEEIVKGGYRKIENHVFINTSNGCYVRVKPETIQGYF